jgi:molybdopterin-binding protein
MNELPATIKHISTSDALHIIEFDVHDETLLMMTLDIPDSLQIGSKVRLAIKPIQVAIGKNVSGQISFSNRMDGRVVSIKVGELLCSVIFETKNGILIKSIITKRSLESMDLKVGETVASFCKASELSIMEVSV